MKSKTSIHESWLIAAVLGATWAASEIILGSFLHNLRIPFKGNILTAIGMTLLIAASYRWKENGIFWKSGLICALLKTISPSAMIFGPMIAIFMESVLFGVSVRFLGRNAAGYILGSALAQSWVFFQKIFNFLIFYGFNIVAVYEGMLKFAEKQLSLPDNLFWEPLILLMAAYMLFGSLTAVIGMRIGRNSGTTENILTKKEFGLFSEKMKNGAGSFTYSPAWLIVTALLIPGCMLAISHLPLYFWLPFSILVITLWVTRYKRAMRQLSSPKFWISFIIITLLAALALTYISGDSNALINGLMTGLEMNVRAAVVILGFSVLGTELYNPKIRLRLQNSIYRNLNESMELAFGSLPHVFSHLPDARTFLTHPGAVVRSLITLADERVQELKAGSAFPVFIVTGEIAEGKSTFIEGLAKELRENRFETGGFYAARILEDQTTIGYDLVAVNNGIRIPYVRINDDGSCETLNRYTEIEGASVEGDRLLSPDHLPAGSVVFIDEIGNYEMNGKGWKKNLEVLLTRQVYTLVISVRTSLLNQVTEAFGINRYVEFNVTGTTVKSAAESIISRIRER